MAEFLASGEFLLLAIMFTQTATLAVCFYMLTRNRRRVAELEGHIRNVRECALHFLRYMKPNEASASAKSHTVSVELLAPFRDALCRAYVAATAEGEAQDG